MPCPICNDTGWVTIHKQGDPAPSHPGWFYLGTTMVPCSCRSFILDLGGPYSPPAPSAFFILPNPESPMPRGVKVTNEVEQIGGLDQIKIGVSPPLVVQSNPDYRKGVILRVAESREPDAKVHVVYVDADELKAAITNAVNTGAW